MTNTQTKFKPLRKLTRLVMGNSFKWIVLDENGVGTNHQARKSEIDHWYAENK